MIISITTCEWKYEESADRNNNGEYCSGIYWDEDEEKQRKRVSSGVIVERGVIGEHLSV